MSKITIKRGQDILAHHTTESPLSHYGQPVWVVEDPDPAPGPITWQQGETKYTLDLLEVKGGWAIVRQPDGYLAGIIWSDGTYYADMIVDDKDWSLIEDLRPGVHVRGTVVLDPDDPEDLGAILLDWGTKLIQASSDRIKGASAKFYLEEE